MWKLSSTWGGLPANTHNAFPFLCLHDVVLWQWRQICPESKWPGVDVHLKGLNCSVCCILLNQETVKILFVGVRYGCFAALASRALWQVLSLWML